MRAFSDLYSTSDIKERNKIVACASSVVLLGVTEVTKVLLEIAFVVDG